MTQARFTLILAFAVVASLTSFPYVRACSCSGEADIDAAVDASRYDAVFDGEAVLIQQDEAETGAGSHSIVGSWVRFRSYRSWKGPEVPFVWIHTGALAGGCGIEFRVGERYLVFARLEDGRLSTGICLPTAATRERPKAIEGLGRPKCRRDWTPDPLERDKSNGSEVARPPGRRR